MSYARICVALSTGYNIRPEDIGQWHLAYVAGGVEVHPGKHHTNDRTYAAQTLVVRRKQLIEMRKHLMFLQVSEAA